MLFHLQSESRHLELGATTFDAEGQRAVWRFAPSPARAAPR